MSGGEEFNPRMAYQFTEYGSSYPAAGTYYDNTGYYQDSRPAKGSSRSQHSETEFQPVRMYPSGNVMQHKEGYNYHILRLSCVATFCCPCFGLIGMIYALLGYTDHKQKDFYSSSRRKNCALGWSLAAVIISVLGFLASTSLIAYYVTVGFPNLLNAVQTS